MSDVIPSWSVSICSSSGFTGRDRLSLEFGSLECHSERPSDFLPASGPAYQVAGSCLWQGGIRPLAPVREAGPACFEDDGGVWQPIGQGGSGNGLKGNQQGDSDEWVRVITQVASLPRNV